MNGVILRGQTCSGTKQRLKSLSELCHSTAAHDLLVSASLSARKILNVFQCMRLRFFRACGRHAEASPPCDPKTSR